MATMSNGHAASGPVERTYTIRVTNLPTTLQEEAIELMFSKHGKVTGSIVFPNKKELTQEAFISYAKYEEAEAAINKLDKTPPLSLRVEFKDKSLMERNLQEEINIQLNRTDFDYRNTPCILDNQAHMKKSINMGKPKCTPSPYQVSNYTSEDELLCPVPTDPSMYNPYEQPGPYKDLNLMYSRGAAQVLKDGRRRICFGRGYTYYDLPEPHSNIANLVATVCEIRNSDIYEYAPDDIDDESGICKICSSPTAFRCQKCNLTFYCSRPCQFKDWPQHKIDCQAVPNLVKKIPTMSLKEEHEVPIQNGHKAPLKISHEASPKNGYEVPQKNHIESCQMEPEPQLRRPKPLPQHQQQQAQMPQHHQRQQQQQHQPSPPEFNRNQRRQQSPPTATAYQEKPIPKSPASVKSQASESMSESKNETNRQMPVSTFKAESTSFAAPQQKSTVNKSIRSDDGLAFTLKTSFISKEKFEHVIVNTVVDKGDYWVQKVDDYDAINELFEKLEAFAKNKPLIEPYVNLKCIVKHEDMWYRAKINAVLGDGKAMAFFVDFGTFFEVNANTPVASLDDFEKFPLLARRVQLVENTNPKFFNAAVGDSLSIKAVADIAETGIFKVEVQDIVKAPNEDSSKEAAPASPKATVSTPPRQPSPRQIALEKLASHPSVLSTLTVGQEGIIVLHAHLAKNELNGSVVPQSQMEKFELLFENLAEACSTQFKQNPNYEPIIGDFICGEQLEGEWYRGIVIGLNPVQLAVIDEARIFYPTKCTSLPRGFQEIVSYGVLVKLATNAELTGQTVEFKVLNVSESKDSVAITLVSDEAGFSGKATLTAWTPKPEQKGLQYAKLTSGREVQIIEALSQNMVYVHSKEPEEAERRHRLEQEIAKCALKRQPLRDLPVVGQIVMAHYENDGNYYRAIVVRAESKSNIQIKYIDYGNDANVKFDLLYELPDELKEEEACVAKVKLTGVEQNVPMTDEATSFLTELIAHEIALKCTFNGCPLEDGVVLKTPKNEIVNDLLAAFLKPTWQQEDDEKLIDKPVYTMECLPPLKVGDVGDEVQALVLCYYDNVPSVMLAPNDETSVGAIHEDLVERIQEYVKSTSDHYIPKEKELCIAMFEGVYYRALCIHSSASPDESRVLFIDYGNTERVKHKDIRIMTKDFMDVGALATLCTVSPMIPNNKLTTQIVKRLGELLPMNDLITIKIISEDSDGIPAIDIPEIRVKLIEEKLL